MRIMGFSKKWDKLNQSYFTTFRFPRRDRDWGLDEQVQIVYRPRSKDRQVLGVAEIISKEKRAMAWHGDMTGEQKITEHEALLDGFDNTLGITGGAYFAMWEFLWEYYGGKRLLKEPMNKLTLHWVKGNSQSKEE